MLRYLIALTLFAMLSSNVQAQSAGDPRKWADEFMETLVEDGVTVAHGMLMRSRLAELNPKAISDIRGNMEVAEKAYGKSLGFEFTGQRNTGQSLRVLGYLERLD